MINISVFLSCDANRPVGEHCYRGMRFDSLGDLRLPCSAGRLTAWLGNLQMAAPPRTFKTCFKGFKAITATAPFNSQELLS